MKTITVKELRAALAALPKSCADLEVRVWLPGSTIAIGAPFQNEGTKGSGPRILLEGNIDEGSALDELMKAPRVPAGFL